MSHVGYEMERTLLTDPGFEEGAIKSFQTRITERYSSGTFRFCGTGRTTAFAAQCRDGKPWTKPADTRTDEFVGGAAAWVGDIERAMQCCA